MDLFNRKIENRYLIFFQANIINIFRQWKMILQQENREYNFLSQANIIHKI